MEIRDFAKGVVSAGPEETMNGVAHLMEIHNVGAVVIVDKQRPIGIVTDRDLAIELGARGTSPYAPVSQVMTAPVDTVSWTDNLISVTETMRDLKVRRLVVVDDRRRITGMVTFDDLLRVLVDALGNVVQGINLEVAVK